MATSEVPLGLFIAIPVYFALMVGLAIYAFFSTRRRHAAEAKMGVEEDAMSSHFLSGRSLGPFVSACTLFASIFSGYTVVGVPNEAFYKGWVALRWIPGMQFFALGYVCTSSRLAKASLARNHQSPVDFITDRYRSQILRYTTLFFQVFPSIIYLTAQISSIHSTFNVLFGISLNNYTPVVLICLLIVALEWIGGLQSVAMTDAAQGLLMVLCFITASFAILSKYGPWSDLDWETYPQPSFYQTPDGETQWNMWEFMFLLFSGFTMPHMIQRVYAASSMKALKVSKRHCVFGKMTCMQ
jgi:Na+/proline symporter